MSFRISALPAGRFEHLFGLSDDDLRAAGATPMTADAKPGFPCRVALRDAEPGERVLLLNFEHQPAETPYRSAHAIFVIDGAREAAPQPGEIPEVMRSRLLSVRAFSAGHMMMAADIIEGANAGALFERLLGDPAVAYLQAHYAKRGCFAARVERA